MPEWVVSISVGPVGDFIGGGRRSRDLWWGSTWISECTLAAARVLPEKGLIVPSPKRVEELRKHEIVEPDGTRSWANWRYGGRISNHLLARVEASDVGELRALLKRCEAEAHHHLAGQLRNARRSVESRGEKLQKDIKNVLVDELFESQIKAIENGEFVELFAAWAPVRNGLPAAIGRVREILDARKTARLFDAPRTTNPGRRKSDLDAGRDSVLHSSRIREANGVREAEQHLARRRLGIGTDEELDAVGLARRIAVFRREEGQAPDLGRLPFPPVNRVATDSWLRLAGQSPATRPDLDLVKKILHRAKKDEIFFSWCSPALDPEVAWEERHQQASELFPYDTSFLLEGGLEALYREMERVGRRLHDREEVEETLRFLDELTPPVRRLHQAHGMPPPYFALLFMDGDGVGRALEAASGDGTLDELVRQLDSYADCAEPRLRKEYFGRAFYIGGDDLAAYLPVDKALGAAVALAKLFREKVQPAGRRLTLSAGIVIGHVKSDLRSLRRQAQEALSRAKKRRAAAIARSGEEVAEGWLQIVELPRSGSPRSCVGPLPELARRMEQWQQLLAEGSLSLRSPRLLLGLQDRFADPKGDGGGLGIELARHRIWAQIERSPKKPSALQEHVGKLGNWREAGELADELAIAARFHRIGNLRPGAERRAEP